MTKTKPIPIPHPGQTLLEDFMQPLGLSQYRLAKDIGVSPLRISQITRGLRSITADTALRLARYTGTTAQFWLNLQTAYELRLAEQSIAGRIEKEVKILERVAA
jgi:addiction module HigA family antidote